MKKIPLKTVILCAEKNKILAAQNRLVDFIGYTQPDYQFGWFNELICLELDHFIAEVKAGKMPRLMIFAPPRSGKSEMASRRLPAYVLGKYPTWSFIACSYSADLANRMSLDTQRIIQNARYQKIFPNTKIEKSRTSGAINKIDFWETVDSEGNVNSGAYRAAGVTGGITGQGFNIGLIDDPAKDYKTASSPTYQESVMDWYDTTFSTRADPRMNGIIIILTRWHPNDLAGQLLQRVQKGARPWRILSFPMVAEEDEYHALAGKRYRTRRAGDILFPERMPESFVDTCRDLGPLVWESLYQQRPTIKGGGLVKSSWFGEYRILPRLKWRAIYGDTAQKTKESSDYSVFLHAGIGMDDRIYLIDVLRGKWDSLDLERHAVLFWDKCKTLPGSPLRHMAIEDKSSGTGLIQRISRRAHCPVIAITRHTDKYTRLMDTQGYIESGYVMLPASGSWVTDFLMEMESINANFNTHDDQLDCLMDAITAMKITSKSLSIDATATRRITR